MSRRDRWVYLVPEVESFRQDLSPDRQETFNEGLVRVYCDPHGERTGAVREVITPPLVHYVFEHGGIVFLYRLYKYRQDDRDRIEVFAAFTTDELAEFERDST